MSITSISAAAAVTSLSDKKSSSSSSSFKSLRQQIEEINRQGSSHKQLEVLFKEFTENLDGKNTDSLLVCTDLLCFLKAACADLKQEVFEQLKEWMRIERITEDIEKETLENWLKLENELFETILSQQKSNQPISETAQLLTLYGNILERLWLIPRLIQNPNAISEQAKKALTSHSEIISKLMREKNQAGEIGMLTQEIETIGIQAVRPWEDGEKFKELKEHLQPPHLFTILTAIYEPIPSLKRRYVGYFLQTVHTEEDKRKAAELLCAQGQTYELAEENKKALVYFRKAFKLIEESAADLNTARTLGKLAHIHHLLGRYSKSIKKANQSLKALEEVDKVGKDRECQRKITLMRGKNQRVLGASFTEQGDLEKAEKALEVSRKIDERAGNIVNKGRTFSIQGKIHEKRSEYKQAKACYKEDLQIAQDPVVKFKNKKAWELAQARAYGHLGNIWQYRGKYDKALKQYQLQLDAGRKHKNFSQKSHASLGIVQIYYLKGEYETALKKFQEMMDLAELREDEIQKISLLGRIGCVQRDLGKYVEASNLFNEQLALAEKLESPENREFLAMAHGNLAALYTLTGNITEAQKHCSSFWTFAINSAVEAQKCKVHEMQGNIYCATGDGDYAKEQYDRAKENYELGITSYENALRIYESEKGESVDGQMSMHLHIGNAYRKQKKNKKALSSYQAAEAFTKDVNNPLLQAALFFNLGCVYEDSKEPSKALQNYQAAMNIQSKLEGFLKDPENRIRIFNNFAESPFFFLELLFLKQKLIQEALVIADARRSRELAMKLSGTDPKKVGSSPFLPLLNTEQMKKLAKDHKTIFVVYSLPSYVYVVTEEHISYALLPETGLEEKKEDLSRHFPFCQARGEEVIDTSGLDELYRGNSSLDVLARVRQDRLDKFKGQLVEWYRLLISPIESLLPKDEERTVTIVPDGILSRLPFAIFRENPEGKYLIEKHPLRMIPSLQTLNLLSQTHRESLASPLLVGNPDTGDPKDNLALAEKETECLCKIFNVDKDQILTKKNATVENVSNRISTSRWVHLACHGEAGKKLSADSVMEGRLKLACDDKHREGHLYAQQIAQMKLQADLVFMSACYSGAGSLQKEGCIGPVWSFLAAGAASIVAAHWRIPESNLTVEMVERFYSVHLKEKKNKAQALRAAMRMAIKMRPDDPDHWGGFFLSGLDQPVF